MLIIIPIRGNEKSLKLDSRQYCISENCDGLVLFLSDKYSGSYFSV